jgi:hypothetical protein
MGEQTCAFCDCPQSSRRFYVKLLACALWWEHWEAGYLTRPMLEESLAALEIAHFYISWCQPDMTSLWQKLLKK